MKTLFLSLISSFLLSFSAFSQVPRLEIHHIGAGDGDATLIIAIDSVNALNIQGKKYLDTAVILIDGQRSGGGKEVWRYVRDTVNALSPKLKRIDYIVVSHLHIDHYGGVPYVISQAKQNGWNIRKVVDRQSANYSDFQNGLTIPDSCYDSLSAPNPDAASYKRYQDTLRKYKLTPTFSPLPGNNLLSVFKFDDIKILCVVSCGLTFALNDDQRVIDTCFLPITNQAGYNYYKPRSENDLSIGWLIEFQGFHYLTLGDLGGLNGGYTDGETPVTKWLLKSFDSPEYHMCANKVSHHGSRESTSKWFADKNNFTVSVFPASLRSYGTSQHALPTQTAIENLKSTGKDTLFYTFVPQSPKKLSSYWKKNNLEYYNDVIIKVMGEPGYDDNVTMSITQRTKKKKGGYQKPATVVPITCNKGHDWAE